MYNDLAKAIEALEQKKSDVCRSKSCLHCLIVSKLRYKIEPLLAALQQKLAIDPTHAELELNEILASHSDPRYHEWKLAVNEIDSALNLRNGKKISLLQIAFFISVGSYSLFSVPFAVAGLHVSFGSSTANLGVLRVALQIWWCCDNLRVLVFQ